MMVLNDKYRPTSLDGVCGQEHIKKMLANQIQNNRLAHSYMFIGPAGTGKTTLARILASMINCSTGPTTKPPADDKFVASILSGRCSTDVIEMDAASNNSVDNIRDLRQAAQFSPVEMSKKIYIIDECHMLSTQAWNALLKIIEEPPKYLMFIFCTTEAEKVPDTIETRCMSFDFRALSGDDITAYLKAIVDAEKLQVDEGAIYTIAYSARGSLRRAIKNLNKVASFGEKVTVENVAEIVGVPSRQSAMEFAEAVLDGRYADALAASSQVISCGVSAEGFLCEVANHFHALMMNGVPGLDMSRFGYSPRDLDRIKATQDEQNPKFGNLRTMSRECIMALSACCKLSVFNQQAQRQVDSAYAELRQVIKKNVKAVKPTEERGKVG